MSAKWALRIALFWTLFLATSCLLPASTFKPISFNLFQLDRAIHLVLYFTLSVLWVNYCVHRQRFSTKTAIAILSSSVTYGILIEILQSVSHLGRSYEFDDIIANCIGAIVGVILAKPLIKKLPLVKKYLPFVL